MHHFGLIGRSLGHSFSKKFFSAKFQIEQIDADYELIELDSIEHLRSEIIRRGLAGFNVTIPYKESIIAHLDELSDEARAIGAVNCVAIDESGRLVGHNTDIRGIEATLQWIEPTPETKALVLGTGGASKAVQHALKNFGIEYHTVSRDKSRGDYTYAELSSEVIRDHRLIINTTPVGMSPDTEHAPELDYEAIGEEHAIFDLVYNPATTEFMRRSAERGARTFGGMLMLQTQAIASWHIWKKLMPEGSASPSNNQFV